MAVADTIIDIIRSWYNGTTAIKTDGSAVTQPVSVASLPLPALASSSAVSQPIRANSTYSLRSDTFATTSNGVSVDVSTNPLKSFTLCVVTTGVVTVWDIRLEGSLDNSTFTQILQHTNTTGSGVAVFSGTLISPCLYFRSRCAGLTLGAGTNCVTTILGLP